MMAAAAKRQLARTTRITERNVMAYRHEWIVLLSGFFEPLIYLFGIGYGVGGLVGSVDFLGRSVPYSIFVAPALMASAAMNGAITETTFNFFFKLRYAKTYDTVLATPLGLGHVVGGEVLWALTRGSLYSAGFIVIMVVLHLVTSWWALLALPAAVLLGMTFACLGTLASTFVRDWPDFDLIQIVLLPMFLFSGTFYPLSFYAPPLQGVIEALPLYHGIHLLRSFTTGTVDLTLLIDIGYLGLLTFVALRLTRGRLARRLLR